MKSKAVKGLQIATDWVNRNQTARSGNLWFAGPTLYSYEEPIAVLHQRCALITSRTFSATTNQHLSYARQVLAKCKTLAEMYHGVKHGYVAVPFPRLENEDQHVANLDWLLKQEDATFLDTMRSSSRDKEHLHAEAVNARAAYIAFFEADLRGLVRVKKRSRALDL